jgi:Pectate lyase superfamily protein
MSNVIYDNTALPADKLDSGGGSSPLAIPTRKWSANDANRVLQMQRDTQTIFRGTTVNVRAFGAVGDGVTDDATAILAAIAFARTTVSGGTGAAVVFPKGTWITSQKLVCPDGVALVGAGGPGGPVSVIKAHATFNDTALITNELQVGNQEYSFLKGLLIRGNRGGGAICSVAVVNWVSLFINSAIYDCIVEEGSNVGLRIAADGSPGGMGPILVLNCWIVRNTGHNILVEDAVGNNGAATGIRFVNVTSEHPGTGKSAIYLKGNGRLANTHFWGVHIELGDGVVTNKTGITIDGAAHTLIDGVELLTSAPASVVAGIVITNVVQNVGIQIRGIVNNNLINPVISDLKNSVTIGAVNPPDYVTADVQLYGSRRFLPTGGKGAVFQNTAGTDRAWWNDAGQLTGQSANGAGLDVVADPVNGRAVAYTNNANTRAFGWYFPDNSFVRFRAFTAGIEVMDVDNAGFLRFWNSTSFLAGVRIVSELAPPQITSNQNDYAPSSFATAGVLILTADVSRDITGFAAPTGGRLLPVYNNGTVNIVLKHDVTSTAANRIIGRGGADTTLTPKTCVTLWYSTAISRWLILGDTL